MTVMTPPVAGPGDATAGAHRLEWLIAEIQVRRLLLQQCPTFTEARRLWQADIAALAAEAYRLLSPPPPPPPRRSWARRLLRRVHVSRPRSRPAGQGPLPAGHFRRRVSCARQQP
jgi:hypothetical protein